MNVPPGLHTGVPRRLLFGGLLATAMLAVGGVGAGAVPRSKDAVATALHLSWLYEDDWARTLCSVVVGLALLLLVGCWWQLRHLLDQLSPGAVLVVAGLWSLPLLVAPPLFSRDVYAYAGQGHLVANHIDPYIYGPGDYEPTSQWSYSVEGIWRYSPSPYGPVWLWICGLVLRVAGNLVPGVILLRFVAVGGLLLVAWALPRIAISHGVPPQRALWLGLANPFILLHGVAGAHNDALMVGLLVCGIAIAGRSPTTVRLIGAAALITVAALVKLPAAAALGFLPMLLPGWRSRGRAAAVVLGTAVVTGVALTTATGLGWGWLHTSLDAGSARLSIFSPLTGIGVLAGHALELVGLVQNPDATVRIVLVVGFGIGGVLALGLLLRAHHLGPVRALGLALVAVVALAPIVQPWYLLWGLVLLAAVGTERTLLPLGALSVALCLALAPNGRSLIRPPLYGVPVVAAVVVAAYLVHRSTRQLTAALEPSEAPLEIPA